ncbi:MAG: hypothetical protein QOI27_425 [Gaiellaceae bacterium]|nr:hypothetical protein [Gaiellaceae bacterium]
MLLSSCVVWRHLEWDEFRAECPGGDERLQRAIWERLDDALEWLVSLGAEPVWHDTENPRTTGKRFDPRALTALLARDVELETPLRAEPDGPLVLATGGFGKRLAEQQGLLLRANPWSDGAGLEHARREAELAGARGAHEPGHAGACNDHGYVKENVGLCSTYSTRTRSGPQRNTAYVFGASTTSSTSTPRSFAAAMCSSADSTSTAR